MSPTATAYGRISTAVGVAEAVQLALHDVLTSAGGTHHARLENYDEILELGRGGGECGATRRGTPRLYRGRWA